MTGGTRRCRGHRPAGALRRVALALIAALLLVPLSGGQGEPPVRGAALAQDTTTETSAREFDWDGWQRTAKRAETILTDAAASTASLEILRGDLVEWRSRLASLRDVNESRIATIEQQIEALGPTPAEGETEAPEIAARRAELAAELAKAKEPKVAALEAFKRANGLIKEIDDLIRTRLREDLITRSASPLSPELWGKAVSTAGTILFDIADEIDSVMANQAKARARNDALAFIAAALIAALVLMTRAGSWLWNLSRAAFPSAQGVRLEAREQLHLLLCSLLPWFGVLLLIQAIRLAGFEGVRVNVVLDTLPTMAAVALATRWLGRALFEGTAAVPPLLGAQIDGFGPAQRWQVEALGLLHAGNLLVLAYGNQYDVAFEAIAAGSFVPLVLSAALFGRLSWIAMRHRLRVNASPEDSVVNSRILRPFVKVSLATVTLGALFAAAGYFSASQLLVYGVLKTAAILGGVAVLQRLLASLWLSIFGTWTGQPVSGDDAGDDGSPQDAAMAQGDGLVPVLIGILLVLAAIPLLALSWGMRQADLLEYWSVLTTGVTIGARTVSITDFLTFVVVFAAIYTATRIVQSVLRASVLPRTRLDTGARTAIVTGTGYAGILVAALAAISASGIDLSGVALVAGALSVGIGFGLQAIVSNFVSGIILLIERPVREGDWVDIGGNQGYVRRISVRATVVETFDRATVVIPNSDLVSGAVTNYTYGHPIGRVIVPVGVAYGTDTRKVERILREIGEAHPMRDKRHAVAVNFQRFGADALEFDLRIILKDVNWMLSVKSDINHEIARRFAEEGIEIPYAQRDIHLRDIDRIIGALSGGVGQAPAAVGVTGTSAPAADTGAESSDKEDQ